MVCHKYGPDPAQYATTSFFNGDGVAVAVPILLFSLFVGLSECSKIGVCYGRNADDLPTPDKVAQLVQQHSIKYVRIYDSNIQVIKAFANTGVELMVGVPNSDLLPFAQYQSNVDTWLKNSILPYYPAAAITYITVGAEVTESPNNVSALVVPAMTNVLTALKKVGLHKRIRVSSTHSLGILSRSFPPSAGAFNSSYAYFLKPMLEFLVENQSPFMVDIYPYYAYRDSPSNVSLSYALFSPTAPNETRDGIREELGLFYPDQTSVYSLDWTGKGNVDIATGANITSSNETWCVASSNASEADLQNALNWACGSGNVDCSPIQPSQPCYQPDTLASHASYAFNSYYQQNGATDVACSFGGAGVRTTKDPSKPLFPYFYSKMSSANSTASPVSSRAQGSTASQLVKGLIATLPLCVLAILRNVF
uniref:X8 domain-containing protein n=1 Tax=Ananas comosus var. bracteatus TaxID=296719 RepID=A0A6V7P0I8_ANACO|nr:unnamed protein product [Ananas comosus var. bracteatus]